MLSHLVLVYLLLTWVCYCLTKFVQQHKFWGSFTSSWKHDLNWTFISLINVHFKFHVQGDCFIKPQNNVSGKSRDYIKRCHSKKSVNKLKVSWGKSLTKKKNPRSYNYALLTKVQYILALIRTIIRTILATCSRQASLFKLPQVFEEYVTIILP